MVKPQHKLSCVATHQCHDTVASNFLKPFYVLGFSSDNIGFVALAKRIDGCMVMTKGVTI